MRFADMNVRTASAQSDWADPRTTARRHLAYALVAGISHKQIAVRIDGHASGIAEAGVGAVRVDIPNATWARER